jgi:hypothetical protein
MLLQRIVQPLGGFLVARGGPVFGPVFHGEHEAQGPHLAEGGDLLAFHFGALGLRQAGHGAAHVHGFGLEGASSSSVFTSVSSWVTISFQRRSTAPESGLAGQRRQTRAAGQRLALGHFQLGTIAQQHGQVFGRGRWGGGCRSARS